MSWRNANNNVEKHKVQGTFFRLAVEKQLMKFLDSEDKELKFPATLNREERIFIENYVTEKLGLHSKVIGKGAQLQIVIYKTSEDMLAAATSTIELRTCSKSLILKMLELLGENSPNAEKGGIAEQNLQPELVAIGSQSHRQMNSLSVPPISANPACIEDRQALPIFESRDPLLQLIRSNQVLIVESSTGSGKSTQIPQYILEECGENNIPCRVIVAQPRRICATSLAERVSFERGEEVGTTVGYQIRLQSKVSPTSNLIYVTNGVILRMLMSGKPEDFFQSITHLIIDEVHERDKFSDFLLICVREYLSLNPNLRVVIMSATIESTLFKDYFGCSDVVKLGGMCHEVKEFFLEDLLKILRFSNGRVDDLNQTFKKNPDLINKPAKVTGRDRPIKEELKEAANEILDKIAASPDCSNSFIEFSYSVKADGLPVNFRHAATNKTALMFAVEYGLTQHIEKLLNLKADPTLRVLVDGVEVNCLDIAIQKNDPEVVQILVNYLELLNGPKPAEESVVETSPYDRMLLDIYYDTLVQPGVHRGTFLEDVVDLQIAKRIIIDLHFNTNKAYGILVFLPGHDEIVQLANLLSNGLDLNHQIFILHSQMQTTDQVSVFDKSPPGVRKIILATNIAESSITVNDVVYVIDSGKEKQKEFNAVSHVSSLRAQWISKASAKQRKGRAGRTSGGFCYRLYSRDRYNFLVDNPKPEFLRCEMMDLCLQAKMIGKPGQSIANFLQKAISPPTDQTISHSLKILRELGALNNDETFTQMGLYLADLPMNPKYGKMLIYGIFFKCLDPILTIVSILSVNDPFALLYNQEERDACHELKNKLEEGSYSDHFVLLRVFQRWNEYQTRNEFDGGFCEDNFVNSATLHRIAALRMKLIGYLRSVRLINSVGNLSSLNQYSHNWSIAKACLAAGSYPEIARIDKRLGRISTIVDPKVIVNPGSVLRPAGKKTKQSREIIDKYPSDWLIFEEKNLAGVLPMTKICTLINSIALVLTAGRRIIINDNSCIEGGQERDENMVEMEIDSFVKFLATPVVAMALKEVRDRFNALLNKFLRNPEKFVFQENDEILIEGTIKLLEFEDEQVGFKITHPGIGARPRIITRSYGAPTGGELTGNRKEGGAGQRNKKTSETRQRLASAGEERKAEGKKFEAPEKKWNVVDSKPEKDVKPAGIHDGMQADQKPEMIGEPAGSRKEKEADHEPEMKPEGTGSGDETKQEIKVEATGSCDAFENDRKPEMKAVPFENCDENKPEMKAEAAGNGDENDSDRKPEMQVEPAEICNEIEASQQDEIPLLGQETAQEDEPKANEDKKKLEYEGKDLKVVDHEPESAESRDADEKPEMEAQPAENCDEIDVDQQNEAPLLGQETAQEDEDERKADEEEQKLEKSSEVVQKPPTDAEPVESSEESDDDQQPGTTGSRKKSGKRSKKNRSKNQGFSRR